MRSKRPGVTLIELLVVIAIITTLATLIVAVAPRFGERQRASRGAGQLQSWLNLSKQKAIRDRHPVGIRLPSGANPNYITDAMYVEVPDESIGGSVTVPYPGRSYQYVQLTTTANIMPGLPNALLLPGDVILIPGPAYAPRQIVSVQPGSTGAYLLQLDQALTATPSTTSAYRVSRQARPVVGEPVLQLPKDVGIDITQQSPSNPTWYRLYPPLNTGGSNPFDILFSPTGEVVGFTGISRICLWVRDISLPDPGPTQLPLGYNTLVTVYTRTGLVTSHEIYTPGLIPNTSNSNNWNPFLFTQDGLSSGY
jgi:prepilin-type N-terminal cleavage/methylation domain-containing protein